MNMVTSPDAASVVTSVTFLSPPVLGWRGDFV